jgi:hypothetical protein
MLMRRNRTHQAPQERVILTRRRLAFPLLLAAIMTSAACAFSPQSTSSTPAAQQLASPTAPSSSSSSKTCGVPPCDKYLSRGETRTLDSAISGHPIASAIALHLVVSAFCGGILCVWGEGVTFVYVERETHHAAQNHECLRVHVLPQGHTWQLVSLDTSNQSPYCTN